MIRFVILAMLIFALPAGFVLASRLKRILDLYISRLEHKHYREVEEEYRKQGIL